MTSSATFLISFFSFLILLTSVLAQQPRHDTHGRAQHSPYRRRSTRPEYTVRKSDAEKRAEEEKKRLEKQAKEAEKAREKADKEAEKAREEAEKHCPELLVEQRIANASLDKAERDLANLTDTCGDLDRRQTELNQQEKNLDDRQVSLDLLARDLAEEEERLVRRERALGQEEEELREREANIPTCKPPRVTPAPAARVAGVCEACGSCEADLECRAGICQRAAAGEPSCAAAETCGAGERRVCKKLQSTDLTGEGMLTKPLMDAGKFFGKTKEIPGCVDGMVRFNCDLESELCVGFRFCLQKTFEECATEGLTEPSRNIPVIPELTRQVTRQEMSVKQGFGEGVPSCCVLFVASDCFEQEVCECMEAGGAAR
ncbi:unnamed protein product [Chondrus crispus]|uniref:Uncharacterized protein n=1 Tax=Chondrus crispus TaxID=2769 RepID=R7QTV7_CHOCR|nr:unnamed protein product [Chondrus crispus]CDF40931.1 unnamed protein product [Chondrus crispus]|eukprot:XP_005711225.1 unnamed protein product [Chondrus crispus]